MKHVIFNTYDKLLSSIFCNTAWKNEFLTLPRVVQQHIYGAVKSIKWFLLEILLFLAVKEFIKIGWFDEVKGKN